MNINYLEVIVAAVILMAAVHGYKKGFLRLAVSIAGLIAIVAIVVRIAPIVSEYIINNEKIYDMVREKTIDIFSDEVAKDIDISDIKSQTEAIEALKLPDVLTGALIKNNNQDMYDSLAVSLFKDYLAGYLSRIMIKGAVFVILFLVFAAVMMVLFTATNILSKIPVFKTLNKLTGLVAGGSLGVFAVWIAFLVILVFGSNSLLPKILPDINSSILLTELFNRNILLGLLLR